MHMISLIQPQAAHMAVRQAAHTARQMQAARIIRPRQMQAAHTIRPRQMRAAHTISLRQVRAAHSQALKIITAAYTAAQTRRAVFSLMPMPKSRKRKNVPENVQKNVQAAVPGSA